MRTNFLELALNASGKTKTAVAREMGISRSSLENLLNPDLTLKFETFVKFMRALGWADKDLKNISIGHLYEVPSESANKRQLTAVS